MKDQYFFRILLVDDDPLDAGFVIRALQDFRENVSVRHVEDADEAIKELQNNPYDIVILDINLNGTSGLDAIKPIRSQDRTALIPIVMFTSSNSADDIQKAYTKGSNAYVEKPLSIQGYRQFAAKFLGFWADTALLPNS